MNRRLVELARLYGIQTSYLDMTRQRRHADPNSLLLVLHAMGAGVDRMGDVPEALRRRKEELRRRKVEPVVVAWDGKLGRRKFEFGYHVTEIKGHETFVISAPTKAYFPGQSDVFYSPPREEGWREAPGWSDMPQHDSRATTPSAPSAQPPLLTRRGLKPSKPSSHSPRLWGVFAPVYALHSKRNPAAGDLTDFETLIDWMHDLGGSVAATLPLLGAFLDEPFEPSPYSPATRLFWNEFYIDIERVPEFKARGSTTGPKPARYIDYRGVMAHKRRILEKLSEKFFANPSPERLRAFRKFVRDNKGIEDYAQFRAVMDRRRTRWQSWPARLREGTIRKSDYDEGAKNYHLYSQWIIQEQLRALSDRAAARGQFMYLDLPLGLHGAGYDTWRNRDLHVRGIAGGAPPDPVFTKGQNWGFPPMNPEELRRSRYQYVIAFLQNHLRYARLLRVDHVMGLHRLFWIPDGLTGDKGVYVEYPADELWAILSVESHRHRAGIVGENLGTVPPAVNAAMQKHDIRQMYVVQYEIMGDPDNPKLPPPPEKCVASLNTHDMPPYRAFLDGLDIDDRVKLGLIDEKTARKEHRQRAKMRRVLGKWGRSPIYPFLPPRSSAHAKSPRQKWVNRATTPFSFLSQSMANIVLANLEDLWEETLPQNVPATSTERPNWRRRARLSLEQIRRLAGIAEVLSHVFAQRSRSLPL